jgi:hypothetical protein
VDLLPLARRRGGVGGEVEGSARAGKRSVGANATGTARRRGGGGGSLRFLLAAILSI